MAILTSLLNLPYHFTSLFPSPIEIMRIYRFTEDIRRVLGKGDRMITEKGVLVLKNDGTVDYSQLKCEDEDELFAFLERLIDNNILIKEIIQEPVEVKQNSSEKVEEDPQSVNQNNQDNQSNNQEVKRRRGRPPKNREEE